MQNGTALLVVIGLVALGVLLFILLEALWPRKPGRRPHRGAAPTRTGPPPSPPRPRGLGIGTPAGPRTVGRDAPEPQEVAARRATPQAVSWTSLPGVVQDLLRQHEFAGARRLVDEALDAPDLPAELREVVSRLRAEVADAEVGQLTATALREAQRGSPQDVLSLLALAEGSLRAVGGTLPDDRRDELTRRLWLTCTRLAARRLDAADPVEAVDWLFRSMPHARGRAERLGESTASIARALAAVVEECVPGIRAAIAAGRLPAARAEAERCDALVRKAADAGVPAEMLDEVAARVRELLDDSSPAA